MAIRQMQAEDLRQGDVIVSQGMLARSTVETVSTLEDYRVCDLTVNLPDGTTRKGKHYFRGDTWLVVERF